MFLFDENPENREACKIVRKWIGAPQPPRPSTTKTHRTAALTTPAGTVHWPTRRGAGKNTQRNTRQPHNDRKQTQNNRRTPQDKTLTVEPHRREVIGYSSARHDALMNSY